MDRKNKIQIFSNNLINKNFRSSNKSFTIRIFINMIKLLLSFKLHLEVILLESNLDSYLETKLKLLDRIRRIKEKSLLNKSRDHKY